MGDREQIEAAAAALTKYVGFDFEKAINAVEELLASGLILLPDAQ